MMCRALTIVAVLLLAGVAMAKTEFHQDDEADFSTFHTYRWKQGAPAAKGGVEKRIVASVDENLQAQGLRRVEDDSADLDVATFVLTDTNIQKWGAVAATSWGTVWSFQVRDTTKGMLILRITRAGTQDMVWHVMEQQIIEPGQTSAQLERKVDRIIRKFFKKYPAPRKKK